MRRRTAPQSRLDPTSLSAYRLMWLLVMFDLPVVEADDRKAATEFRTQLLREGFSMAQFSVYFRFSPGEAALEALSRRVIQHLPPGGKVDLLEITDRQYQNIKSFRKRVAGKVEKNLELFELL